MLHFKRHKYTHITHTQRTLLALFQRVKNNSRGTHSLLFVLVAFQVNKAFLCSRPICFPEERFLAAPLERNSNVVNVYSVKMGGKRKEDEDEEEEFSSSSSEESESKSSSESGDDDHDELTMDSDSEQQEEEEEEKKETNNAFSRAFTSLLKRGKKKEESDDELSEEAKDIDDGRKKGDDAVILPESKSRQTERALLRLESQKRKRERIERLRVKEKGHFVPSKVGADIEEDLKEKRLKKTATHGVAQLFNAIAKAQKNQNTSSANTSLGGGKTKAKFLAELKKDSNENTKMTNTEEEKDKKKRKVWEVLADDYMMGRGKMKDFDNANGFFDKHKNAGKNDSDGRLRDGEEDDDDDDDVF